MSKRGTVKGKRKRKRQPKKSNELDIDDHMVDRTVKTTTFTYGGKSTTIEYKLPVWQDLQDVRRKSAVIKDGEYLVDGVKIAEEVIKSCVLKVGKKTMTAKRWDDMTIAMGDALTAHVSVLVAPKGLTKQERDF